MPAMRKYVVVRLKESEKIRAEVEVAALISVSFGQHLKIWV